MSLLDFEALSATTKGEARLYLAQISVICQSGGASRYFNDHQFEAQLFSKQQLPRMLLYSTMSLLLF